ncbi:MAG TPA: hypothetical protein VGZ22_26390 [Isosphaeraceae bacterium]|jgi:ppGpp synthetase/RelA/SpoT-type nucleotidyltranferase|nr:hypothetical protein [Isosphaeraceae bacterium]
MIVPSAIRRRFEGQGPDLASIAEQVRQTVFAYSDREGYAYAGRPKTLESLAEKIETGRFGKWSDLDDMFGCVIVIPTLDREPQVLDFLRGAFHEVVTKYRGSTKKSPDVFRFDATRFIGRLRSTIPSDNEDPPPGLSFEVQVRSAFEHAWSVTTHALYKGGTIDWKTKRLAAQLKATVEQLDTLVQTFEATSGPIVEHPWPGLSSQREIAERFARLVNSGRISEQMAPKDWSRFAENLSDMIRKSNRPRSDDLESRILKALDCVERELPSDPLSVPHSLSLLQYVFAVIAKDGILVPPFRDYFPLITEDLRDFYRDISKFDPGFSLDG